MTTLRQLKESSLKTVVKNIGKNVVDTIRNPVGQANKELSGKKFWTKPINKSTSLEKLRNFGKISESRQEINKLISKHGLKVHTILPTNTKFGTTVHVLGDMDIAKQKAANKSLEDAGFQNHKVVHAPQTTTAGGDWNKGVKEPSRGKKGSVWTGN